MYYPFEVSWILLKQVEDLLEILCRDKEPRPRSCVSKETVLGQPQMSDI